MKLKPAKLANKSKPWNWVKILFVSADVAECSEQNDVCQQGNCVEKSGDYHCNCYFGFAGRKCDKGEPLLKKKTIFSYAMKWKHRSVVSMVCH